MNNIVELKPMNLMSQKRVIDAYLVLMKLGAAQQPVKVAYGLYKLRKQLEPTFNFRMEQERLVIERYHGTQDGNTISFADPETAQKARVDLDELNEMEVQIDFEPVSISMEDIAGASQSMNDLEALDGFVVLE